MRNTRTLSSLTLAASLLGTCAISGVGATNASASTRGGGCRSSNAGWANEPGGLQLNPCLYGDGYESVYGLLEAENPNRVNADYCAQLLRVDAHGSTSLEQDYGCSGWTTSDGISESAPGDELSNWQHKGNTDGAGPGIFVLQIGFWATINGNYAYYGNAQSPRVYIDN
ncbi:hypothetical protein [Actinacidiphila acidipaludis]|uniref:Uncharacterized protein n=1 Tax=Actinacidiphila acidipaludis TaxID=2873382 RepID=A0ABS7QEV1_9ACTN|nr:hypothetical protein [Streptomyces acidipaludis]MBY8881694.1 hypothetical protein [Streptomyces acidipaludis]